MYSWRDTWLSIGYVFKARYLFKHRDNFTFTGRSGLFNTIKVNFIGQSKADEMLGKLMIDKFGKMCKKSTLLELAWEEPRKS